MGKVKKIAPRPKTKNLEISMILETKNKVKSSVTNKKRGFNRKKIKSENGEDTITIQIPSSTFVNIVDESTSIVKSEGDEEQITLIVSNIDENRQFHEEIVIIKDEDLVRSDNDSPGQIYEEDDKFFSHVNVTENSFECRLCPKTYKSIKVILSHLHKEHQISLEISEERFRQFQMKFRKESKFESSDKNSKHMCLKCGKSFSSKTVLSDHERSDCGSNPIYECNICNKRYHSAGSLKTHKTMHTGELNHVCPYCGQTFRTAGQVKIHSRKHTGDKPYKCNECGKAFGYRESLLTHESIHTGVKRFMCECGQRFSCISNLKAHRKSHRDTCGKFPIITKPIPTGKS